MHKEQSLNRKFKRGQLTSEKNEATKTLQIFRITKRGKKQMIAEHKLND